MASDDVAGTTSLSFAPSSCSASTPRVSTQRGLVEGSEGEDVQQRAHNDGAIEVGMPNDHDRPPRKFLPGRMCAESGCDTRLSIYNKSDYCSLHEKSVVRVRGRRPV